MKAPPSSSAPHSPSNPRFQMEAAPRQRLLWFWSLFLVLRIGYHVGAQITDPVEARLLNTMFERWGIGDWGTNNGWNISGNLCSGVATDSTPIGNINPGIKCGVCTGNGSTCHITALRVYALNVIGPLPDELWNLTFLTEINLDQNYLTGPIPPAIASLTRLQTLSIALNALQGRIPSALGQLRDLRVLSFGHNNLSGPLPPELGNLTRLEQIYINSCGASGPIPVTFANLRSMQTVWAMDNGFTGGIPAYIGDWSSLQVLRLQGNSFRGPIPSSFSNLTTLTDLRISDVLDVTSSLDFLQNLTSLATLNLRNNYISSSLPTFFNNFPSLQMLDLSFNNLTGSIPDNIFNHSRLTNLYLGNNSLTGALPSQRSLNLQNIDVSYNDLSGTLPQWINQQNLSLNIVANNFRIDRLSRRVLPDGLNCLRRGFPCNRDRPRYSRFAIKCGGPEFTSSNGIVYERDEDALGPANYYIAPTRRWGVTNVGLPNENNNPRYQTNSSSQITNTPDPVLFQTSRISAGSLRYYGLGLENGNYTVTLQFAETIINGTRTWTSIGQRVFDVFIQGTLLLRDFNIRREAGDVPNRAVVRSFNVSVENNYVEIHLFWAGRGTCCVPAQGTYGPAISAISATPNFVPTVSDIPPGEPRNHTGLIIGVVVGVVTASLVALLAIFLVRRKRRRDLEDQELKGIDVRPYTFSFYELKTATNDFSTANKLGEGGFGPVFKGTLGDGRDIAVKQLSKASPQGKAQFVSEIKFISAVRHRNLVKLYGCCIEGNKRLLVYEFLEKKSLDLVLFGDDITRTHLDWEERYNICLGVARGLTYLHEESRLRIVHRDVKAGNILLDKDLTPKIADFGLARLYEDNKTHISTGVLAGTSGYMAPEYVMRGHLSEKADVFSFGVLSLEILTGRRNSDERLGSDRAYLLEWAWRLHESKNELELVDPVLQEFNPEEARRVIGVALLCTQSSPTSRPPMSRVTAMLSGDIKVPPVTSRPTYLTDYEFNDVSVATTTVGSESNHDTVATSLSSSEIIPGEHEQPILGTSGR